MKNDKKVLVLGATGAMGQYLVPILAQKGYCVDAVSLDDASGLLPPGVRHIKTRVADYDNLAQLRKLMENNYDAIVDFMIYPTVKLQFFLPFFLKRTGQYVYLSSYRIYDDKEYPIRETSPRLIDTADDLIYRNSEDYGIFKARGENMLRAWPSRNWTVVRPAITYSYMRNQLVTLEAPLTVARAFAGKKVIVPREARDVQTTMSWGGDVARMIAELLFNEKALGEIFTVATSEHHSWGEIADYYKEICNLEAVWVDKCDYIKILCPDPDWYFGSIWPLDYDRLFNRVIDNSKILATTGIRQDELRKTFDGLAWEIGRAPRNLSKWPQMWAKQSERMDAYLAQMH